MRVSMAMRIGCLAVMAATLGGCNSKVQGERTRVSETEQAKASSPSVEFKILGLQVAPATDSGETKGGYRPIGTQDALRVVLSTNGKSSSVLKSRLIRLEDGSEVAVADVPVHGDTRQTSFVLDASGDWAPGHYLLEVSGGQQVVHRELTIRDAPKH